MAGRACVATDGREEGVRYAACEVTAYEPVKESPILRPAVVGERVVSQSLGGAVPVSMAAGHFPTESKDSF
jgi:hypothetical protein